MSLLKAPEHRNLCLAIVVSKNFSIRLKSNRNHFEIYLTVHKSVGVKDECRNVLQQRVIVVQRVPDDLTSVACRNWKESSSNQRQLWSKKLCSLVIVD